MTDERSATLPVGVIVRRTPGVTRWAKWAWKVVGVLPGATDPGNWRVLREDRDITDYHAATADLTLYRTDTEAYVPALATEPPLVWVVFQEQGGRPEVLTVTASAFEAQDYGDNGDDIVEPVPMPEGLEAWIRTFMDTHHSPEEFVKRKRKKYFEDQTEDGVGDARVRQIADVYRTPKSLREH